MTSLVLVSVIMPSYCSERYISQAISSVVGQTCDNWELIIVDDASPDDSNKIIERYVDLDSRIRLIKLEKNSGPAVARNRAIRMATGRYISFLDADDMWLADKLEKQIGFMREKNIALSYSSYEIIDESGNKLGIKSPPGSLDYTDMLKENQMGCLTATYDSKILGKCYMPLLRKRQDYGLWLSILRQIPYALKAPGILATYRVRQNSVSSDKFKLLNYNFKLFHSVEGLPVYKAVYYVGNNIIRKIVNIREK